MLHIAANLLPWLALAGVPWVIHLILFRKSRREVFPSLMFLQHVRTWARQLQLRRLLLLLVRTALILYLALALMEPAFRSQADPSAASSRVIVIDDRALTRMTAAASERSAFDLARQTAVTRLSRLPADARVAVKTLSDLRAGVAPAFRPPARELESLELVAPSNWHGRAEPLVSRLIEDMPSDAQVEWISPFALRVDDPRLIAVPLPQALAANLTLARLSHPDRLNSDQPLQVTVEARDELGRAADALVELRIDDRVSAPGAPSAEASGSGRVSSAARLDDGAWTFQLAPLAPGIHRIEAALVQSGADGYPQDDRRFGWIEVAAARRLGIAGGADPSGPLSSAASALGIDVSRLWIGKDAESLKGRESIIVAQPDALDDAALRQYVRDGGTAYLFAGNAAQMERLLPAAVRPLAAPWDVRPLRSFSVPGTPPNAPWRDIELARRARLDAREGASVWMAFDNGPGAAEPAMIHIPEQSGAWVLSAFSLHDPNLAAHPLFLVWFLSLLEPHSPSNASLIWTWNPEQNQRFDLGADGAAQGRRVALAAADGPLEIPLLTGFDDGRSFAQVDPSSAPEPGFYELRVDGERRGWVSVEPPLPPEMAAHSDPAWDVRDFSVSSFFYLIALLLMLVELLILRTMAPGREGAHVA